MSTQTATMPFPARLKTPLVVDPVFVSLVMTILLGGLVILASASISVSDSLTGDPFHYVERQLMAVALGGMAGFVCLFVPMQLWRALGPLMLLAGLALLLQPTLSFVWDYCPYEVFLDLGLVQQSHHPITFFKTTYDHKIMVFLSSNIEITIDSVLFQYGENKKQKIAQ